MTPAQHQQIDALFMQIVELEDPAARAAALAATFAAIDDPEVHAQVVSLLAHAGQREESLATSVGAVMRAAANSGAFEDRTIGPGTRFERYRIEHKLGQGGMGDVYAAVRENDFRKQVALKIVRHGLDSDFARGRFQQERQTLAGLEHPYIARLLDGGEAANGCPYLVLELVDGVPIDLYTQTCTRDQILNLFLKVCEAVDYAHRNLIIHRDLKPANILVTADGTPKLLDFGIAKLLSSNPGDTQTAAVALTPQYASPEQIRNRPITTASDVYSLGVILYQLLTNTRPYQIETTTALEMERVICIEPPAPPHLGNELDDILMMSLRKEPERRYTSVSALVDDIHRFLDGRPVLAAPDTFRYRARKFIGLHKIGISAVAAVILVLAAGLASTLYQMRRAEREKREAQQRFQQVRKLANTFLFDFNDAIADVAGTTKARALIVKTAQEYLDNLSRSPNSDPELQAELAHAYFRVADVQGAPRKSNLGDAAGAEANYKRAISLYEPLTQKDSTHTLDLVTTLTALAVLQADKKHIPEAQSSIARAVALLPSVKDDGQTQTFVTVTNVFRAAADIAYWAEDLNLNVKLLHQAIAYDEAWKAAHPGKDEAIVGFFTGTTHQRLGTSLQSIPLLDQAEAETLKAIADIGAAHTLMPENARYTRNLTVSQLTLSNIYDSGGIAPELERYADAALWANKALALLAPQVEAEKIDINSRELYLRALLHIAYSGYRAGQIRGVTEVNRALEVWREVQDTPTMAGNAGTEALEDLRSGVRVFSLNGLHREANELAAQNLNRRRKSFAGISPASEEQWRMVGDLEVAAQSQASGRDFPAARRYLDQAQQVAAPIIATADRSVDTAIPAASLYGTLRRFSAATGHCADATEWQRKEIQIWKFTAPSNPYSAMRFKRAQSLHQPCPATTAKTQNLFYDN